MKLERIQLPTEHAEERNSYNHVLAERLIRIMNYAAQPGRGFLITSTDFCVAINYEKIALMLRVLSAIRSFILLGKELDATQFLATTVSSYHILLE